MSSRPPDGRPYPRRWFPGRCAGNRLHEGPQAVDLHVSGHSNEVEETIGLLLVRSAGVTTASGLRQEALPFFVFVPVDLAAREALPENIESRLAAIIGPRPRDVCSPGAQQQHNYGDDAAD